MQNIIFGAGSVRKAAALLRENHCKKTLLVCDSAFDFLECKAVFESLDFTKFSDFTPNPLYEDVVKGVEHFKNRGCDSVVALGGGSAIDVAKCIKLFSGSSHAENYLQGEFQSSDLPLIAIPTTAGTGSESTKFAVIYRDGVKQSIAHESIIPNVAVLDPELLKTLPLYQKKSALLDALCQGIESWWSIKSTAESRGYSKQAVELVLKNYKPYIFEGSPAAAEKIMKGANLAGRAINISETTAPHAMSYKMSSLFGLPHGQAAALSLPPVFEYMLSHSELCSDPRGNDYLSEIFLDISCALGQKSPADAVRFFRGILRELDINPPEISPDKLDILTKSVNPTRLKNNPVELTPEAIRNLYKQIGVHPLDP